MIKERNTMTKRITAVFLLFIILLISGCGSSPKLTAGEYREELFSRSQELFTAQMKVVSVMMDSESGEGYFSGDPEEFEESCKEFENAIKRIEKINPPDEYKSRHRQAVKALDNERKWLKAVKSYTKARTPEALEKADAKIQKAANYENSYPSQLIEIIRSLDEV